MTSINPYSGLIGALTPLRERAGGEKQRQGKQDPKDHPQPEAEAPSDSAAESASTPREDDNSTHLDVIA